MMSLLGDSVTPNPLILEWLQDGPLGSGIGPKGHHDVARLLVDYHRFPCLLVHIPTPITHTWPQAKPWWNALNDWQ
jgi:hypothetical protein